MPRKPTSPGLFGQPPALFSLPVTCCGCISASFTGNRTTAFPDMNTARMDLRGAFGCRDVLDGHLYADFPPRDQSSTNAQVARTKPGKRTITRVGLPKPEEVDHSCSLIFFPRAPCRPRRTLSASCPRTHLERGSDRHHGDGCACSPRTSSPRSYGNCFSHHHRCRDVLRALYAGLRSGSCVFEPADRRWVRYFLPRACSRRWFR